MTNKKEGIIDATIEAFFIRGEKWSLDDVARTACCSKTLIIQYYGNKEDLLSCCFDNICHDIRISLSEIQFPTENSVNEFREYISAIWRQYFQFLISNPKKAELYIQYSSTRRQLPSNCIFGSKDSPLETAVKKILGDNFTAASLFSDDFDLIAKYIVSVANVVATGVIKGSFGNDPDVSEKIINLITEGIFRK